MAEHRFIVVAYYTEKTLYEEYVPRLRDSMIMYKVPHHIQPISNLGTWQANTGYKPTFILEMMARYQTPFIVYVDCDAEFLRYPMLFDTLDADIAVHLFKKNFNIPARRKEILSGTIFMANNDRVRGIVEQWQKLCAEQPKVWDQRNLGQIIGENFHDLPGEYCAIFDRMNYIPFPIILHHQASRRVRKNSGVLA